MGSFPSEFGFSSFAVSYFYLGKMFKVLDC